MWRRGDSESTRVPTARKNLEPQHCREWPHTEEGVLHLNFHWDEDEGKFRSRCHTKAKQGKSHITKMAEEVPSSDHPSHAC